MSAEARVAALRARLVDEGADAIALTCVPNIAYCTGILGVFDDEPAHVALLSSQGATLYTDSRYAEAFRRAFDGSEWDLQIVTSGLAERVGDDVRDLGLARLALETTMPHARYLEFSARLDGDVVEAAGWVESLRAVKDAEEIAQIEAAQALTDHAFARALQVLRAGATERDVALDLEFFMRKHGSDGVAFAPIVASGENSALPHATPTDRVLEAGDFVVLDFGAKIGEYCADMTRTVVIGTAGDRHREIYQTVRDANLAGTAAVRPGLACREVDAAARSVIEQRGFGELFGHGVGHGVGREVHELPAVGPRNDGLLCVGNVITIEPGVYIPGFGGVRIEDLVVVEEAGARMLTRSTKDLLEL